MPGDNPGSDNVGWRSLIKNIFLVLSPLELGDELELVIEDIGILRKTVV
ncbi:fumarylacetoacetase [Arenibacter algicola]|uniref:Fumarylacetoacetase n=2 Tax=Arenibacter algicola TaxID=616991 RepID=A0A221UXE1_9FLAO|nr:fumarylacetoacetase [Arenibacter algicola]